MVDQQLRCSVCGELRVILDEVSNPPGLLICFTCDRPEPPAGAR